MPTVSTFSNIICGPELGLASPDGGIVGICWPEGSKWSSLSSSLLPSSPVSPLCICYCPGIPFPPMPALGPTPPSTPKPASRPVGPSWPGGFTDLAPYHPVGSAIAPPPSPSRRCTTSLLLRLHHGAVPAELARSPGRAQFTLAQDVARLLLRVCQPLPSKPQLLDIRTIRLLPNVLTNSSAAPRASSNKVNQSTAPCRACCPA